MTYCIQRSKFSLKYLLLLLFYFTLFTVIKLFLTQAINFIFNSPFHGGGVEVSKLLHGTQLPSRLKIKQSYMRGTKRKRRNKNTQKVRNYQRVQQENSLSTFPLYITVTNLSFSKILKVTIRKAIYIPFSAAHLYFACISKTVISECKIKIHIFLSVTSVEVTGSLTQCEIEKSTLTHVLFTSLHPLKRKKSIRIKQVQFDISAGLLLPILNSGKKC